MTDEPEERRRLWSSVDQHIAEMRHPGPVLYRGEPVIDPRTGQPAPDLGKAVKAGRAAVDDLEKLCRLLQRPRR